eukprot:PhM_4_TR12678/c0_g1_i1/m.39755
MGRLSSSVLLHLALVIAVVVLLFVDITAAATAAPTAAQVKKMKVKELKIFLAERDTDCKGCVEKSDYVNAALRVIDKKPDPTKRPGGGQPGGYEGAYPTVPLWEAWAGFAEEDAKAAELSPSALKAVKNVVENSFMRHGKATATKLKKHHKDVLKTSLMAPYYAIGRRQVRALVEFAKKKGEKPKADELRQAYEKLFIPWMTNVGIENTNPMYEWMKQKDEL